jgi:hypothetical protein
VTSGGVQLEIDVKLSNHQIIILSLNQAILRKIFLAGVGVDTTAK